MEIQPKTLAEAAWESIRADDEAHFSSHAEKGRLIFVAEDVLAGSGDQTPFADACRAVLGEWDTQDAHVATVAALNAPESARKAKRKAKK